MNQTTWKRKMNHVLVLFIAVLLAGCGSPVSTNTAATATSTTTTTTPAATASTTSATKLELSASPNVVNSDNSSPSTITATVLDASNAVVSGATVAFSASIGQLSAASGTTDATGKATVSFSSGSTNINQIATITAVLTGVTPVVSIQLPVQIVGSTVSLSSLTTNLTAAISDTLSIAVKDAGSNPIANTAVTITQTGAGSVSITPATLSTDISGVVVATVTGVTPGNVTLTIAAGGAVVSQVYTVTSPTLAFSITAPTVDPFALAAGTPVTVAVQAPAGIANVTFASSMGIWNGVVGSSTLTVPVVAGVASASFSSAQAGVATIQVFDALAVATTDKMQIVVSQPATNASQITLQSNVNVVAPSGGGAVHTATMIATVRDANGQAVGGSPVVFSIPNSIGGGETVSPVVALTDSFGKATTIFTSGSVSTGAQGVNVNALVLNPVGITPAVSNIVIGSTAGSVVIGRASKVVVPSTTVYELPMSVLVADSNGNAVAGATVSLKAFPTTFRIGHWVNATFGLVTSVVDNFLPCVIGTYPNEDLNRDLVLNVGEDVVHTTQATTCTVNNAVIPSVLVLQVPLVPIVYAVNNRLDPPNSAAGTLPQTVITDANGVANFVLTYLKGSSHWIESEITASTLVLGTENTSSIKFWLPSEKVETAKGFLPASIFGQ